MVRKGYYGNFRFSTRSYKSVQDHVRVQDY